MKKDIIILSLFSLLVATQVMAVCPVCTIAVVGGVTLSEYLGIDDTIAGLWIGGLIISMSLWTIDWLNKKNIKFMLRKPLIFIGYGYMTYYSLELAGLLKNCQKLWGYPKLGLGAIIGMIIFSLGVIADKIMRQKTEGKAKFPFQKVVMPVGALAIASIVFYFITKC
jgi:hypothetical protein